MLRLAVYNKELRVPWHLDNECKDRLSLLLQIVGILRDLARSYGQVCGGEGTG